MAIEFKMQDGIAFITLRGLRMEQLFLRLLQTSEDVQEGAAAFSERRSPQFKGL